MHTRPQVIAAMPTHPQEYDRDVLHQGLQEHFGFREFLEGQEEPIRAVLEGDDAVVVMPTGSGKSLCYQMAAMQLDGVSLVVSPLIALMKDQVDGLAARGLPATFLNSSLSAEEMSVRLAGLRKGEYRLVYVAPERFRNARFNESLAGIDVRLLAIDEAHCISQWGHDFRPDYLRLRQVLELLPGARVMALTATATPDVRLDIIAQLGLGRAGRAEPQVFVHGFARPNLRLAVTRVPTHSAKLNRVLKAIQGYGAGIVYCATRKQVVNVSAQLAAEGQSNVLYHGGLGDEEREEVQDRFMNGQVPVVVATNAFGMGIDRSDVRFVLHWDVPGSIEAYYQEVGRAGRDGEASLCELLFNYADVRTQEFFLDGANPTREQFMIVWDAVRAACNSGPVTRSVQAWMASMPGLRNGMAVGNVMGQLERAGLVRRELMPGEKTLTTSIVEGADIAVLDEQFKRLDEKRARDEHKLKTMLRYVDTPRCRHGFILKYFGDEDVGDSCQACDNCGATSHEDRRAPTEEEWTILQQTLSCVARMKGRFGRGRVAQVLVGSRAKPVLDARLDELPTYGLLKDRGEAYVRALVDRLIGARCMEVAPGEYPTVGITELGREVMWRKAGIALAWPAAKERPAAPKRAARKAAPQVDAESAGLFEALRAWRIKLAKARHVPAYAICADRTLAEIAKSRPVSFADLEEVHGMGPSKVAQFGDAILELVDGFREE